jgi:nucleotide-binding universal stress UspA family protein
MKILVTTDLSKNSKTGIRFAIRLASQNGAELIFYQIVEILQPSHWNRARFESFKEQELSIARVKLDRFVKEVYRRSGVRPGKFECVVQFASPVGRAIIDYAQERKANLICMSTRGAGRIRRIIGTYTSYVITHSPIPVVAVPKNYRQAPISHILYASDLSDLNGELKKVRNFADSLKSKVSVLHYDYLLQPKETKESFEKATHRFQRLGMEFHLQRFDWEKSLGFHLTKAIRKFNPSAIVLFTRKNRNWFQKLLSSSKSAVVSFDVRKPLLVYSK